MSVIAINLIKFGGYTVALQDQLAISPNGKAMTGNLNFCCV